MKDSTLKYSKVFKLMLMLPLLLMVTNVYSSQLNKLSSSEYYLVYQTMKINITIRDVNGVALSGASIQIEGSNVGTQTDENGKAVLNVKVGDVITVSLIGFSSHSVTIGTSGNYIIILAVPQD